MMDMEVPRCILQNMFSRSEVRERSANETLTPILEPMVAEVLKATPDDSMVFLPKWLADRTKHVWILLCLHHPCFVVVVFVVVFLYSA